MAQIHVEPSGVSFDILGDETIIEAAWRNHYTWPTICNGQGSCKTCVCMVIDGADQLESIESYEAQGLAEIATTLPKRDGIWRLACQAKVHGDVRLRKVGVRPA